MDGFATLRRDTTSDDQVHIPATPLSPAASAFFGHMLDAYNVHIELLVNPKKAAQEIFAVLPGLSSLTAKQAEAFRSGALELEQQIQQHPQAQVPGQMFTVHLCSMDEAAQKIQYPAVGNGLTRVAALLPSQGRSLNGNLSPEAAVGLSDHLAETQAGDYMMFTAYPSAVTERMMIDEAANKAEFQAGQIKRMQQLQQRMLLQAQAATADNIEAQTGLIGALKNLGGSLANFSGSSNKAKASEDIRDDSRALVSAMKTAAMSGGLPPAQMLAGLNELASLGALAMKDQPQVSITPRAPAVAPLPVAPIADTPQLQAAPVSAPVITVKADKPVMTAAPIDVPVAKAATVAAAPMMATSVPTAPVATTPARSQAAATAAVPTTPIPNTVPVTPVIVAAVAEKPATVASTQTLATKAPLAPVAPVEIPASKPSSGPVITTPATTPPAVHTSTINTTTVNAGSPVTATPLLPELPRATAPAATVAASPVTHAASITFAAKAPAAVAPAVVTSTPAAVVRTAHAPVAPVVETKAGATTPLVQSTRPIAPAKIAEKIAIPVTAKVDTPAVRTVQTIATQPVPPIIAPAITATPAAKATAQTAAKPVAAVKTDVKTLVEPAHHGAAKTDIKTAAPVAVDMQVVKVNAGLVPAAPAAQKQQTVVPVVPIENKLVVPVTHAPAVKADVKSVAAVVVDKPVAQTTIAPAIKSSVATVATATIPTIPTSPVAIPQTPAAKAVAPVGLTVADRASVKSEVSTQATLVGKPLTTTPPSPVASSKAASASATTVSVTPSTKLLAAVAPLGSSPLQTTTIKTIATPVLAVAAPVAKAPVSTSLQPVNPSAAALTNVSSIFRAASVASTGDTLPMRTSSSSTTAYVQPRATQQNTKTVASTVTASPVSAARQSTSSARVSASTPDIARPTIIAPVKNVTATIAATGVSVKPSMGSGLITPVAAAPVTPAVAPPITATTSGLPAATTTQIVTTVTSVETTVAANNAAPAASAPAQPTVTTVHSGADGAIIANAASASDSASVLVTQAQPVGPPNPADVALAQNPPVVAAPAQDIAAAALPVAAPVEQPVVKQHQAPQALSATRENFVALSEGTVIFDEVNLTEEKLKDETRPSKEDRMEIIPNTVKLFVQPQTVTSLYIAEEKPPIVKSFKAAATGMCAGCGGGNCATCTRGGLSAAQMSAAMAAVAAARLQLK